MLDLRGGELVQNQALDTGMEPHIRSPAEQASVALAIHIRQGLQEGTGHASRARPCQQPTYLAV